MEKTLPIPTVGTETWKGNYIELEMCWMEVRATVCALEMDRSSYLCAMRIKYPIGARAILYRTVVAV